ncbi:MAG: sugar phosphate isomerase/epimerase [Planctomycetia bacterium]|nr:MAG: sugar phosphate isomerase/epimerase [Planctomycetia bacterium]
MNPLGVCSWSLQPASPADLAASVRAVGVNRVQLALDPIRTGAWSLDATRRALTNAGITVASGMMAPASEDYSTIAAIQRTGGLRPDETWEANRKAAAENARIAGELGLRLVTLHGGLIDQRDGGTLARRTCEVADAFAQVGASIALETGMDDPAELRRFIETLGRADVGLNFDPANILLYGVGEPMAALDLLLPLVRQVHIKDATPSASPGEWGTETPVGSGAVPWPRFIAVVARRLPACDLMIEREGGDVRIADARIARDLVSSLLDSTKGAKS